MGDFRYGHFASNKEIKKMIIFDNDKYISDIKENGIGATDPHAKQKIQDVIKDFIANSTYKRSAILKKVKTIAADYFNGLPDDIVSEELKELFDIAKEKLNRATTEDKKKEIILYESEMQVISNIEDEKLRQLAFSALVVHKFLGQHEDDEEIKCHGAVKVCDSDIFRIAHLDNVSGATRNKLWKQLVDLGYIKCFVKTNSAFRFNPSWIAIPLYQVTFNVDISRECTDNVEYMRVTNYDDVMLYLRYYLNDSNVTLCAECGCPIERVQGKKYCSSCASRRKKESDKARYNRVAIA